MADYTCPKCGLTLKNVILPVFCCELPRGICQHRGPSAGNASCGCGVIFKCNLHGGYCSDRKPVDEFVDIRLADGSTVLVADVGYRCCNDCDDNPKNVSQEEKPPEKPKLCSVCGEPATSMCSAHSPFGMCGEPLCAAHRSCPMHG